MNLRSLAAAGLALPVLAAVYLRVVTRSRTATRMAVVVALAMAATSVGVLAPPVGSGRTPAPDVPVPPPEAFLPIVAAADDVSATPAPSVGGRAATSLAPRTPSPDRTGEVALAAAQPDPAVVRFRPRDGSRDVAAPIEVSVRFTQPMDRSSTTRAFTVQVGGTPLAGAARWAEYDTVLVVRLERRLPAGAHIRLAVSAAARSAFGKPLEAAAEATFTIAAPPPSPTPAASSRPPTAPRASSSGWSWPLVGRITQRFGQSLTKYGYHQGIDIDGDTGDPVRAARAGRVTLAGRGDSCGGIQVHIDHGGGIETWYRHLSALSVKLGQRVEGGQVVGKVGNTGCSLGSHLHFAVRRDGEFVDPLRYLPRR